LGADLGSDYDYPLYVFGDPEMVGSTDAAAAIEAWRGSGARDALPAVERLIASFPTEISPRAMQAFFLQQSGRLEELAQALEVMERIDPDNPYAEFFRASSLIREKQIDAGKERIAMLLRRQDLRPGLRAFFLRNYAHMPLRASAVPLDIPVEPGKESTAGIEELKESIQLDPATAWGYLYLGRALHRAGRPAEAFGHAKHAAALEPSFSITSTSAGELALAAGYWDEASQFLTRSCEQGETSSCALRLIALERAGRQDQAREIAEAPAGESLGGWEGYHVARYWALVGENRRAIDLLQRVVADGLAGPRFLREAEFRHLRGDPEFEGIVAEVKERLEQNS